MNDLISRQAAINEMKIRRHSAYEWYVTAKSKDDEEIMIRADSALASFIECILTIKKLPSAQPERKKGKWVNDRGLYKCSCCNRLWTEWWAISKPIERMRKECPYCPMCGSYNGEEING